MYRDVINVSSIILKLLGLACASAMQMNSCSGVAIVGSATALEMQTKKRIEMAHTIVLQV
jgi:hypothetical protein